MLSRRLPFLVLGVTAGLLAGPAAGAEPPPATASAEQPAKTAEPAAPAAPAAPVGFAPEFGERLAAGDRLAPRDREERAALAAFYAARQHEPVWTTPAGLTPAAQLAIAEIRRADEWGLDTAAFQLPTAAPAANAGLSRSTQADAELALSLAILKYARHARGGRAEPTSLSRNLDRKLALLDPQQVIEQASKSTAVDAYLRSLHPQHPEFEAMRQKYLAVKRGQPVAQAEAPPADGDKKAGKKQAAAAPEAPSLRKLAVNMEQWRWMPGQLGDLYVWVNVPEFMLRVVKDGKVIHTERVIVGKRETPTPVFSQDLEQVIFHPSWGVPESIKRQDILPSLKRGSTRLFSHYKLRIQRGGRDVDPASVDWETADIRTFHVYQPPGDTNVLGVVKFRFPNKHDVYMHDTPTKTLFNAPVRTFSHGCMRVRDPLRLAELLLTEDQSWPAGRVASLVNGGQQNNQVNFTRKIPVHITYFTAMVDEAGKLKQFADIYGHEQRIALGMEGKAHLVAQLVKEEKPASADAIGRLSEATSGGGGTMRSKKEWINNAFGNN
jgi:murein L,D-transpeptidase YcbB/YkuD